MPPSFRRIGLGLCAIVVLLLAALGAATAGTRLALVLGNSGYQNVPMLANPANDAQDMAQALRSIGFDVIELRDASRDGMAKAVHDFSDRLPGAEIALFFYAGHGLQMNGENYLIPVDAKIQNPADVRFNTINLSDIQQEMESNGRTNIIILDACRDNPFADKLVQAGRSIGGRGLLRVDAGAPGSLIVYSTQPNNIALDGAGRNSPFTAALLNHLGTPGLEVRQMISRVRGDVLTATDRKQTPWDSSSLVADVYLAGPAGNNPAQAPVPAAGVVIAQAPVTPAGGPSRSQVPAPGPTAAQQMEEINTDWPGSDYKVVDLVPNALTSPAVLCSETCAADNQCKAWTLVNAGVQSRNARCWLKSSIPAAGNPCAYCTSGVVQRVYEPGTDRPGYDYTNFDLTAADPRLCSSACNGDSQCQAWTYLNPGVQGPSARCWLKSVTPAANANSCCTSGVRSPPLVVLPQSAASVPAHVAVHRPPAATYHYNPAWQASPTDTSCCPNNMLVCPLGRHFCGH